MSADQLVELRGEIDAATVAVIDAVVQATPGANRMSVVREVLDKWAQQERHRAMLIVRVTRGKGSEGEA